MFGIDGQEFLVIILVLIVVVGPKDLPRMLRAFGKATARMRATAQEFRHQFDEAMREMEIDDLADTVDDIKKLDPRNSLKQVFDPIRSATHDLQAELHKASKLDDTQPEVQEEGSLPSVTDTGEVSAMPVPAAEKHGHAGVVQKETGETGERGADA